MLLTGQWRVYTNKQKSRAPKGARRNRLGREVFSNVRQHFLAGSHIIKSKNRILDLHIAGVIRLLLFTLLDVEIGLLDILENIALTISGVVDQYFVIFKLNFPMGLGSEEQSKAENQKENDLKKQPGDYGDLHCQDPLGNSV